MRCEVWRSALVERLVAVGAAMESVARCRVRAVRFRVLRLRRARQ